MKRRALITGISGQDGRHMAELLLDKGYDVWGLVRPSTTKDQTFPTGVSIALGDLKDPAALHNIINDLKPAELYNFAAQSHVGHSFKMPYCTVDVTGAGVVRLLEAVRQCSPDTRVYQASSSEMFGNQPGPHNERTPFAPESPYAVAKVFAHQMAGLYRRSYGMFVSCGICFNHEGPFRGEQFVTRKITKAVGRIERGEQQYLKLGNLNARRDWGFAGDFVKGIWLMLQKDQPADYVLATGETHSVREFVREAFSYAGLNWEDHVQMDESLLRPQDVHDLCGDYSLARRELGWEPKVKFKELVRMMVDHDARS